MILTETISSWTGVAMTNEDVSFEMCQHHSATHPSARRRGDCADGMRDWEVRLVAHVTVSCFMGQPL